MAVALATFNDKRGPLYGPMLRESAPSLPAKPNVEIAVGFEPDRTWISAQWGELAIRKETRLAPQQTSIHLWHGTDVVTVDIRADRLVVQRGMECAVVSGAERRPVARALLVSSTAVMASLALRMELQRARLHAPETTLLSLIDLVSGLLAGDNWTSFLDDESAWADVLKDVRPVVPRVVSDWIRPFTNWIGASPNAERS